MRSIAVLWAAWSVVAAAPVSPQERDGYGHLHHLHHDSLRPDYLTELSLRPRPTAMPPVPRPPAGEPPAAVRGVYLNGWVFSSERFHNLIRLADTTEINAFVIDVKDVTGQLTYPSGVPLAHEIGADRFVRVRDVRGRLAILRAHGIHPIARIVVAKDPLLAEARPTWAIRDGRGGLWRDALGSAWVDAYQDSVWLYAGDLAAEAVLMGFREVQFDYVRFPDEPAHRLEWARYPAQRDGETRRAAIRRRLTLLRSRVEPLGVPFTLDVFGLTTSANSDMGIGQYWEDLIQIADVLLPMVYPSHYRRGAFGIPRPNSEPYAVVRRALEDGLKRLRVAEGTSRVRPYLQSFTLGRPRYGPGEVRAQIDAVEDLGLTEWVLWNARGVYPPGAFRPERPTVVEVAPRATSDEESPAR